MSTKELVERLRITSNMVNMGEKISWGQDTALMDEAADTIERLESERDEWRDAAHLSTCEAHSGLLDEAEAEASTLHARLAKMEEALEWALNNCTESDHPHYPYCRDGKWVFPYLASNAGGFGGGVADAYYDTALEAVLSAKESTS